MGLSTIITETLKKITFNKVRRLARALYDGIRSRMPPEISKIKENPKQYAVGFATNTKDLAAESLPLLITLNAIILAKYFLASEDEKFSIKKTIANDIIGPYLLAQVLSNAIQGLSTKFSKRLLFLAGPSGKQRALLEKNFRAQKKNMPQDFVNSIEDTLAALDSAFGLVGESVSSHIHKIRCLLDFPLEGRPPISREDFEKTIAGSINTVIEYYKPELRNRYARFVREVVSNINDRKPCRTNATLLLGPPGTGKTTSIEKIAKILGIPVVLKKLAGVAREEIWGNSSFGNENGLKLGIIYTAILEAKRESGYGTVILLLDELDKALKGEAYETAALREFLIQVLNPEVVEWESQALKIKFPITNLIIVITANTDPFLAIGSVEESKAFHDRVRYFNFERYTPNAQLEIVTAFFNKLKDELSQEEKSKGIDDTESVVKHLDEKVVHDIAAYNSERRPGVRIALNVLKSYFAYLEHRKFFKNWHDYEFSIKEQYDDYERSEDDAKPAAESAAVIANASAHETVAGTTNASLAGNLLTVTNALSRGASSSNDSNFDAPVGKPMLAMLANKEEAETKKENEANQSVGTLRKRKQSPQSRAISGQ